MSRPELEALLQVQERDTALDRLRYRHSTLPERERIREREARAAELTASVARTRSERDSALADERRLDDEAQTLSRKAKDVDAKLYSGSVASPRELQAMQADIQQLDSRRAQIEEQELVVMERREGLDGEVAAYEAELAGVREELTELTAALAAAEGEVDAEIAAEEQARTAAALLVPDSLLADYVRRRVINKGKGAARLLGDTCQGCRLSIPATEVDRLRHDPDADTAYCDNCGAILVPSGTA